MWGFGVMLVNGYILYKTAHLIIWCKKKSEVLSHYEYRKEIELIGIQKNMLNVVESDNNNKRGRYDVTGSPAGKSIEARGSKKLQMKKTPKRLNDKTLDPVDGVLRCWIEIVFVIFQTTI